MSHPPITSFKALLWDLDGVLTQTADTHAAAWKKTFDEFLQMKNIQRRFDTEVDYRRYVDGKPRYKGVECFLKSIGINDLPYGDPHDAPSYNSICGLGNLKNSYYHQFLQEIPPKVFNDAEQMLKYWNSLGIPSGVISASRNCALILERVGLDQQFRTIVDGVYAQQCGLQGKPHPDVFLEAAKLLGYKPSECVVFEDAESGVEAGKNGNFGLVVGVCRHKNCNSLHQHGADVVINDFNKLKEEKTMNNPEKLPNALMAFDKLMENFKNVTPFIALDYDGTLTPIVNDPRQAFLPDESAQIVKELSKQLPLTVISGRSRQDVKGLVGIDNVIYAGDHGLDIGFPDGKTFLHEKAQEQTTPLQTCYDKITQKLSDIEGLWVEKKNFALAVHYRNIQEEDNIPFTKKVLVNILNSFPGLRLTEGKKVFEIRPKIDWDKGKALHHLLELTQEKYKENKWAPLYIGDDTTDEDAFNAIKNDGVGVIVKGKNDETSARYVLENTHEVCKFLEKIKNFVRDD